MISSTAEKCIITDRKGALTLTGISNHENCDAIQEDHHQIITRISSFDSGESGSSIDE